jgi:hypothetical protein
VRLKYTSEYRRAFAEVHTKMNSLYGDKWKSEKKIAKRIKYAIRRMAANAIGGYPSVLDKIQDSWYKLLHYKRGRRNEE